MLRLGPVVTASRAGLPALNRVLGELPPVLEALGPFTRTTNPLLRQIEVGRRDVTAFLGNVFRTPGRDVARPGCAPQGAFPGFGTLFPRLSADAPAPTAPKGSR